MRKPPGLLIVVDPYQEHIAVAEAKKLNIPIMALVDTNCDPDPIDYVIACNDDALKSVKLILIALTEAICEKKKEIKISFGKTEKKPPLKGIVEKEDEIEVSPEETEEEV